jgi:hypothetical protein
VDSSSVAPRPASVAQAQDDDAPFRRVVLPGEPAAAFEPVQDDGYGGGVQPGPSRERTRAERTVAGQQVETVDVAVAEIEPGADAVVEERIRVEDVPPANPVRTLATNTCRIVGTMTSLEG